MEADTTLGRVSTQLVYSSGAMCLRRRRCPRLLRLIYRQRVEIGLPDPSYL